MIINNGAYHGLFQTLPYPSNDLDTASGNTVKNKDGNCVSKHQLNGDKADITGISAETEIEIKQEASKTDWKYNRTDTGYLPDFKLGDWENTSDILFGGNTMQADDKTYAIYLPQKLQDKMNADPVFAEYINDKLESFFENASKESGILEDGTRYNVIAQYMAVSMDENGEILHTYVRTESYSIKADILHETAANDENALGEARDIDNKPLKNLNIKAGFSIYMQTGFAINSQSSENISEEEKNASAMARIGVQAVITIETAQTQGKEPEIEIRKANGDIIDLETGRLIQKHSGFLASRQKYDGKA